VAQRSIVTGGAGFIGSHVVDALLADGHEVTVIDDLSSGDPARVASEAQLRELDIVDRAALLALVEEVAPTGIFHLAAQASVVASVDDPGRDCDVNVKGTLHVVEAAARCGAPVVYTSTGGALYGDEAPRPTPESHIPEPLSPYGASKLGGEAYVGAWSRSSGLPHAACRLGNVYGPRQNPHGEAGVVAIFSQRLLADVGCVIYGSGKQTRDFVYVADVARANRLALDADVPGPVNIGTGRETDIATIYPLLARAAGVAAAARYLPAKPGEQMRSSIDAALAARVLGWQPTVALDEGLRSTLEFFRLLREQLPVAA
jgi:UDP-glucose 4-epimerase